MIFVKKAAVNDTSLLAILISLVAAMFGIMCALLSYLGTSAINELKLLRQDLVGMDKRLTVVETTCEFRHAEEPSI